METMHQPGEVIADRYRIINTLGRGGVGITYAAEELESGDRVALKALSLRRTTDWKTMELFDREAKVLSQLNHPAIPRYLDYFQTDSAGDRCFYIAQELASGESLAALVENGWQPHKREVRRLAVEVLEILVYLQSLTPPVIHRDIKPSNIIRSLDGQIFLVDFGAVVDSYRHTVAGGSTVVGTYGYMAPEQFRGQAAPATDLYSLGATLLFLLVRKSPADLPRRQLRVDFRSSIRISQRFADWLEKMLEPAREDRFQSAEEALAVLQGERGLSRSLKSKSRKPKGSPVILTRAEESLTVEIPPVWLRGNYHALIALLPLLVSGFFCLSILWIVDAAIIGNSVMPPELTVLCLLISCLALIQFIKRLNYLILGGLSRTRLDINRDDFRLEQYLLGWCHWNIWNRTEYIRVINLNSIVMPLREKPLTFLTMQLKSGQKHRFGLLLEQRENEWLLEEIIAFLEEISFVKKGQKVRNIFPRASYSRKKMAYRLGSIMFQTLAYLILFVIGGFMIQTLQWGSFLLATAIFIIWLFSPIRSQKYSDSQNLDRYPETDYRVATQKSSGSDRLIRDLSTGNKETDYRVTTEEYPGGDRPNFDLAKDYCKQGMSRFSQGDRQGAIEYYDRAISLNPELAEAYHSRGVARSALGDNQTAIEDFDRATSLNPKVETYFYRGVARSALGDNKGAIEDFDRAVVMNPNLAEVYYNRGRARCALGDNQIAIEDFNSAITLNRNWAEAYFHRAMARSILGHNRRAIKDYESAISLKPNWAEAYFYQGIAWSNYGDLTGAIEDFDRAISLNPNWPAYYKRGVTHYLLGDRDRAIGYLTQTLELNPNFVAAYYNRGNARYDLGDQQGATEDYNLALELEPADMDASDEHGFYGRGLAMSRMGRVEEARADLQKAAQICSDRRNTALHEKIMAAIDKL